MRPLSRTGTFRYKIGHPKKQPTNRGGRGPFDKVRGDADVLLRTYDAGGTGGRNSDATHLPGQLVLYSARRTGSGEAVKAFRVE